MQKIATQTLRRAVCLPLVILILATGYSGATIAGEKEGWVIQLETRYVEINLARGGASALLIEEGRNGYTVVDEGSKTGDGAAKSRILSNEVIAALPLPNSNAFIVVEVSNQSNDSVTKITHQMGTGENNNLELSNSFRGLSDAILGTDLTLFLSAVDRPRIERIDLCNDTVLKIADCRERRPKSVKSERRQTMIGLLGSPVTDIVVDSASEILAAAQRGSSEIVGVDARSGKILFTQDFSPNAPPLWLTSAIDEQATFFVSAPRASSVEIFDVDRDFREWSPAGRIDLRALGDAPALSFSLDSLVGSRSKHGETEAWQRLAGKVAVSPNQGVLLIGGLKPNVIHVIERNRTTNRLILDIVSDGLNILDFTLSPDGQHLGLLLEGLLVVLPIAPELLEIDKSAEIAPSSDAPSSEQALAVAMQTRLSQEGFYRGIVDGVWGPQSQAALSRFELRNGIVGVPSKRPNETDVATFGALFVDDIDSFPFDALGINRAQEVREAAFDSFFRRNLPDVDFFSAGEIFMTGRGKDASKCSTLNKLPDQKLWPNILPTVRLLDTIRTEIGEKIHVQSSFQTTQYADCVGTPTELVAAHGDFRAVEFTVDDFEVTPERAVQLGHLLDKSNGVTVQAGGKSFFLATTPHAFSTEQLGDWHAVVASYRPGALGCAAAQADVEEFAKLLSGAGLQGRQIYIARTTISNHFVVTVDAGQDPKWAQQAVEIIHKVASRSVDGKTGADAFMLENKGWRIDDGCSNVRVLD